MNAGISLVSAVYEIAVTAELAIATEAVKKSDPYALTDRPSLDLGTNGIDASNDFMPRDAGPINREERFNSGRIRMAHAACFDANAHVIRAWVKKWLSYFREFSWLR